MTMRTNWKVFKTGLLTGFWTAVSLTTAAQEPSTYQYSAWAGASYRTSGDSEVGSGWGLTLGGAIRLGSGETHLLLFYSTVPTKLGSYQTDLHKTGLQGELGLGIQHSSYGRLSGRQSPFFYGGEWRMGRQVYTYRSVYSSSTSLEKQVSRWHILYFRAGYRIRIKQWLFDLVLPFGLEIGNFRTETTNHTYGYKATSLSIRPTLLFGIQF